MPVSQRVNCDPGELAKAAKCYCFSGIPPEQVWIYLICQWANRASPSETNYILDENGNYITDENGNRITWT